MWDRIAKLSSFTLGVSLLLLGAVQLYIGISVAVSDDALTASTVSAFLVLFPGVVFISYSLRSMEPSRLLNPSTQLLVSEDSAVQSDARGNIVSFPTVSGDPVQTKSVAGLHSK